VVDPPDQQLPCPAHLHLHIMGRVENNLQQVVYCDQHVLDWQRIAKVNEPAT
jgi:hypothetical protein